MLSRLSRQIDGVGYNFCGEITVKTFHNRLTGDIYHGVNIIETCRYRFIQDTTDFKPPTREHDGNNTETGHVGAAPQTCRPNSKEPLKSHRRLKASSTRCGSIFEVDTEDQGEIKEKNIKKIKKSRKRGDQADKGIKKKKR
ncbi:hypothetical protein ElyMa_006573900 [Elysia marginata]|uniref:Uncharacterized protein n=1 Tax=Elysia marginata TaxID=1093978 RepID=A0AAV4IBL9_9GAST|nr:hypothetical protein ElyMa_006573900 [Elysia marginata]